MIDARLPLALEAGGLALPQDGRIAVFGPPQGAALPGLAKERVEIIEGFRPAHDDWLARGYPCRVDAEGRYGAAVVCLPRAKEDARALIACAMQVTDGPVVIDGQKTDGVDSLLRDIRKRTPVRGSISKAHGKLFWCESAVPDLFEDWVAGPARTAGGFWTAPGVFSADAVDPASELLVSVLPDRLGGAVGDLGAGWGYLSAHVLTRADVTAVHLVEAQHMALECARRNVTDARAHFHWADACRWAPPQRLDAVVMNPPFHKGRAADPSLGQDFIRAAAGCLAPHGHLWMVANRHLPYEAALDQHFTQVTEAGGDARFKLVHATKPLRTRSRRS